MKEREMMKVRHGGLAAALCALALFAAGNAVAQTTTDVRNFEIISVDGNYLVVRDQLGTREYNVPADFRFTVDGKSMAVGELKAGMKGTATITKTTTVRPVYVTEVKMGTVVGQSGRSIIVKQDTGKIHRFSQSEMDARGVQLFMDDKPVRVFNLNVGDQITAKIVTAGEPEELTAQQVAAVLANEPPLAAPAEASADVPADAAPAEAAPSEAAAEMAPAAEEPAADEGSKLWMWLLLIIILALIIWLVVRRRAV